MTTAAIRERLINYLAEANDVQVKAFYGLLKEHVDLESIDSGFTDEQLAVLDERQEMMVGGGGEAKVGWKCA